MGHWASHSTYTEHLRVTSCFLKRMQGFRAPVKIQNPSQPSRIGRFGDILEDLSVIQKMTVITTSSVVMSWLVILVYDRVATAFGSTGASGTTWVIGTITPLVVAPVVSAYFVHLMQELRNARDLTRTFSITDVLTGVFNRRHFMAQVETEFAKAKRYKLAMSVIMLDIDHFKSVNDKHGHSAGDDVLVGVSSMIAKCLRDADVLARYGGEEFIVLLPQTDGHEAMVVAERIRQEVETLEVLPEVGPRIAVTASLGVAAIREDTDTLATILKHADAALYQVKTSGRNQSALAN
jgi:diguanylate cyclase (GGDEF)-like protein